LLKRQFFPKLNFVVNYFLEKNVSLKIKFWLFENYFGNIVLRLLTKLIFVDYCTIFTYLESGKNSPKSRLCCAAWVAQLLSERSPKFGGVAEGGG
jgi:hypothetical protein